MKIVITAPSPVEASVSWDEEKRQLTIEPLFIRPDVRQYVGKADVVGDGGGLCEHAMTVGGKSGKLSIASLVRKVKSGFDALTPTT